MLRKLHSVAGLVFGLTLALLAGTGAILSLDPTLERIQARSGDGVIAELAVKVATNHPQIERLERSTNGVFIVSFATAQGYDTVQVDPVTGADLGPWKSSATMRWIRDLHRSLLAGDIGKAVAGTNAAVMAVLGVTGLLLLAAVLGGWRRLGRRVRSTGANRWHAVIGRVALVGLTVSALTGVWMSLATFEIVSDGGPSTPTFPEAIAGATPAPVGTLAALQQVHVDDLRRLTWPVAGDPTDVFGLQTAEGSGYVDQATGQLLNWQSRSAAQKVWGWVYSLHTGQGLWWFGLLLGVSALAAPVLAGTGGWIWWKRRASRPRVAGAVPMAKAEIIILVGSEGGATWGFAATLARALADAGHKFHLGAMNDAGVIPNAKALILLTATYGDGDAPTSATRFLSRLEQMNKVPVAVLGFGDRGFPAYCGFAEIVSAQLVNAGWQALLPLTRIDRQSVRDFSFWGEALGQAIGIPLELHHRIATPKTLPLKLVERQTFGHEVGTPSAILRFEMNQGVKLPRFEAGDLLGVIAPGTDVPRFYSLASNRKDGFIEIAVRRMPDGLCSGYLHELVLGDEIHAFVRANPGFRAAKGRAPVIFVATGCGVGPVIGLLRHMQPERPSALYFGVRDPESDFLYQRETDAMLADGRLSRRVMAFSRCGDRARVQDRLRENAEELVHHIQTGGQVLICGNAIMARDVAEAFTAILAPTELAVAQLKAAGRYREDVY
ncbi:MAG: PepSY domain-containing protein [Azoarcus sp.]|jgi:sulfite reductase (NADPH) flavoprotein alpha-component|nr:PepSY domain-containing protein [Azoarcus sp.]